MQIITKQAVFNNYSDLNVLCLSDAVIGVDFNSLATSGDVINFIFDDIPQGSENTYSDILDTLIASYIDPPLPEVKEDVIKVLIPYVCERNSSSNAKMSWGNGSTTGTMGAGMAQEGKFHSLVISSSAVATNASYQIRVNNISIANNLIHNGQTSVIDLSDLDLLVSSNDYININQTANGNGGSYTATIYIEYEIDVSAFSGPPGEKGDQGDNGQDGIAQFRFGSGSPENSLGNDGDQYTDRDTGNVYSKTAGLWNLEINLLNVNSSEKGGNYFTSLAQNVDSTSTTTIIFENTRFQENVVSKQVNNEDFIINEDGKYAIKSKISVTGTTGNYRYTGNIILYLNGQAVQTFKDGYIRANTGSNFTQFDLFYKDYLSVGDVLQVRLQRVSSNSGNASLVPGENVLDIAKVG